MPLAIIGLRPNGMYRGRPPFRKSVRSLRMDIEAGDDPGTNRNHDDLRLLRLALSL